jgi:NAD(P)-dependent dehydrogenase (short-subunit alcohol dehydrogenase family)
VPKINVDLSGKVALVTGAGRGLGRAIALGLLRHGAKVGVLERVEGRTEPDSLATSQGIPNQNVLPLFADITKPDECTAAVESLRAHFGRVDILINNAGVGMELLGKFLHTPIKFYDVPVPIWHKVVDTNINGTFHMSRAVAPLLVAQGWGRIINVTGRLFVMVRKGLSPYGATKAALESATAIWSADLAGTGVTVNSLSPGGLVDTRMIPVEEMPNREALLRPEIMVAPAVWLCSELSNEVTGVRMTGKDWDDSLPLSEAAKKASIQALVGEFVSTPMPNSTSKK